MEKNWRTIRGRVISNIALMLIGSTLLEGYATGNLRFILFTIRMLSLAATGVVLIIEGVILLQKAIKEERTKQ